jgi:putative ribosome biogenesis GTPase RsgA
MNKKKFDTFIGGELTKAEAGEELFDLFREPLIEEMNHTREQLRSLKYNDEQQADAVNVIIFGPSGAGKSSLIRSPYQFPLQLPQRRLGSP